MSVEKAIERIVELVPKPGKKYPRITNKQLTGKRPKNKLESMGVDLLAKSVRDKINPMLEEEFGIGLIPDDYRGTYKIVPVEERASHVITKRLEKLERQNASVRDMIDRYTMLEVSDEFTTDMLELLDNLDYLDKTYSKLVIPTAEAMKAKLIAWSPEDEE